jgi:carbon storage regulator
MKIVTRRVRQRIKIGETITVTVCEVNGAQCRLGFDVPPSVDILRGEIVKRYRGDAKVTGSRPSDARPRS